MYKQYLVTIAIQQDYLCLQIGLFLRLMQVIVSNGIYIAGRYIYHTIHCIKNHNQWTV